MGRVAEVRARAQRKTGNLYDTWFTRRVSAWVTAALIPTGITPNAVSWLNLLVGAAVCAGIATGRAPWALAGALGIHLYAVLDSVDGELARWHGRSSLRGMFLENWSAYLMINGFQLAVGSYLWRTEHGTWPLAIAVAVAAFGRQAMPAARRTVLEARRSGSAVVDPVPIQPEAAGRWQRKLRRVFEESLLYQTNVWVVLSTLVLVEHLAGVDAPLVLAVFTFYAMGQVAREAFAVGAVLATPWLEREVRAPRLAAAAAPNDQDHREPASEGGAR
jgi:phosphatidylglycerophosphate synthase